MVLQMRRKPFAVCFTAVLLCSFVWAGELKLKAKEGTAITLDIRGNGHQREDQKLWTFGSDSPNIRIASWSGKELKTDYAEQFRDRLQLDNQTGSLTITDLTVTDSGVYQFQTFGSKILSLNFLLTVYSSVSSPSIKVNSSNSSWLTVECSVQNSRDVILSWYRGKDILTQTNSSNLSAMLSLLLEKKNDDGENYSCEAENPVDKKTTILHTEGVCLRNGGMTGTDGNKILLISVSLLFVLVLINRL